MNIREVLRQTVSSIAAHKLRSFLTMFGITWEITSGILLVGLGRDSVATRKSVSKPLASTSPWSGADARASRLVDMRPDARFASPSRMLTSSRTKRT